MRSKKLQRLYNKAFDDVKIEEKLKDFAVRLSLAPHPGQDAVLKFLTGFPEFVDYIEEANLQSESRVQLAHRNIEVSSKELMDANKVLFQLNTTFAALLDSLGQGFFLFDRDGVCLPVFSKACERLLGCKPVGLSVADVLQVPDHERTSFIDWYGLLFEDRVEFDDLARLGPPSFEGNQEAVIKLEFKAVRGGKSEINYILVIATDRTSEVLAQKKSDELQDHVTFLASALQNRHQFKQFVGHSRELFKKCLKLIQQDGEITKKGLQTLQRDLHTLKGATATFGMTEVKNDIHEVESHFNMNSSLAFLQSKLVLELPQIFKKFEIVLYENQEFIGMDFSESCLNRDLDLRKLQEILFEASALPELQHKIFSSLVCVPIHKMFGSLERSLRDCALKLQKQVDPIEFKGVDIRVIPEAYAEVMSSMIHVFRNIATHGIESPGIRTGLGKYSAGHVTVEFATLEDQEEFFQIRISDDGEGINETRILHSLIRQGRRAEAESLSHQQLLNCLFEPGFSTFGKVTDLAGRGVGLDAVRNSVEKFGGTIRVMSTFGEGTTFVIDLPWIQEIPDLNLRRKAS
jgi:two-component system chemotaxis sensor kinase CheA